jgi:oleandomycin transport system permease protein
MTAPAAVLPATTNDTRRPAGPLASRVSLADGLRHTATLAWRTLVSIKHNPMELMDYSIQPLMFVLLFTYVFGGAISGSPGEYLMFALPGIMVQNGLFTTLNTGVGLSTDLTKGVFDRLRSLPIARYAPLAGRIAADMCKQIWSLSLLLLAGVAIGFRVHTNPLAVVGAYALMLAVAFALAWVAVLVGLLVSEPERVMVFGFVAVFPLTFISNAFVSAESMPGWLQAFVRNNPVTFLSDAMRGLLVDGPIQAPVIKSLLWAIGIVAVVAPIAVRTFRKKV